MMNRSFVVLATIVGGSACHTPVPYIGDTLASTATDTGTGATEGPTTAGTTTATPTSTSTSEGTVSESGSTTADTTSGTTGTTGSTSTGDDTTGSNYMCPFPSGTGTPIDAIAYQNPRYQGFGVVAAGPDNVLTAISGVDFAGQCAGLVPDPAEIHFGGPPLLYPLEDDNDFALVRYDLGQKYAQGYFVGHLFGGDGYQNAYDVATDANGNIYVVGRFSGDLALPEKLGQPEVAVTLVGPPANTGGYPHHAFVFSYDPEGNYLWHDQIGGDKFDAFLYRVAVDKTGEVVVSGQIAGEYDLGPGCAVEPAPTPFVARYEGVDLQPEAPKWVRCADTGGFSVAQALDVDAAGGAVVAGVFAGEMHWKDGDGGILPGSSAVALGKGDVFVARWDAEGEFSWQTRCGTTLDHKSDDEYANAVLVGAGGRIYVAGALGEGGSCIHDPPVTPIRATGFVAALEPSPDGVQWVWEQTIGLRPIADPGNPTADDEAINAVFNALAQDSAENIIAVGSAERSIALGGKLAEELFTDYPPSEGMVADMPDSDMIAAKFTCDGDVAWLRRFGGEYEGDSAHSVAVAGDDSIHIGVEYSEKEVKVGMFTLLEPEHVCGGLDTEAALIHLDP